MLKEVKKMQKRQIDITEQLHDMYKQLSKPEEKFITVVDGWRGSLNLKECWVKKDSSKEDWVLLIGAELICRESRNDWPYKILHSSRCVSAYTYLKFRQFSPENPPSVDWPVLNYITNQHFSHFNESGGCVVYGSGKSSLTQEKPTLTLHRDYQFLNIEEVDLF